MLMQTPKPTPKFIEIFTYNMSKSSILRNCRFCNAEASEKIYLSGDDKLVGQKKMPLNYLFCSFLVYIFIIIPSFFSFLFVLCLSGDGGEGFGWQTASTDMQEKHKKCVTSSCNLSIPGTCRRALKKNPIKGST
jgi:hypothetical protein